MHAEYTKVTTSAEPAGAARLGRLVLSSGLLLAMLWALPSTAQVFLPDDPIWSDPDRLDMPAPEPRTIGDYYDFWINTFGSPGEYDGPALNVNTLDEVPNSSWYTNRHYRRRMSLEELRRGPNTTGGPSDEGTWKVVAGKTEGKTAGMQIEDARGDRYLLKFDPPGYIELASGAEVVSTKILYLLGYHVPENYAVRFDRNRLVPGEDATVETAGGEVPVTPAVIDRILSGAARYADGSYRALASKYLEGEPIGPFLYYGTRPDDGNDVFPHEGRRELRGLRLAAAWINHTDVRSINTLDLVVEEDGRQFVRHALIDFGSTLGSAAVGPKRRWDGYEYILDGGAIALRTATLGLAGLEWAAISYPDLEAVGRFEAEHFEPRTWRPQYPNAAFTRCDAEDAFWAAKQVMNVSNEEIRAIVSTARYSEPVVEERLAGILAERRDAIGKTYLRFGGGLDRFQVQNDALVFQDLPATYGFRAADVPRHAVWRPFENTSGVVGDIIAANQFRGTRLKIPVSDEPIIALAVRTRGEGVTTVYLRKSESGREVVGIDRE